MNKRYVGCNKYHRKEDRTCGEVYGYYPREKRNYIRNEHDVDIWLCKECIKLLEGEKT